MGRRLRARVAALSFWIAIVLPVFYAPAFLVGVDGAGDLVRFLGLFGAHVLSLIGGREHNREPT